MRFVDIFCCFRVSFVFFFFNDTATTEIYTLSLHDALPISKPTWLLGEEECKQVVEKKQLTGCRDLEYNWLGTDDQGRDLVARMIYGFRVSVQFGLLLTIKIGRAHV